MFQGGPRGLSVVAVLTRMKKIILTLLVTLLTSGCYLNTASHISALGGYDATYKPNKEAPIVYKKESNYYIEMDRYKKPIVTQYNLYKNQKPRPLLENTGERDFFRIDSAYASYLMGGAGAANPTVLERVKDSDDVDDILYSGEKIPTKNAVALEHKERWSSSVAPLWYSLAGLDWLCVDFPVTIVENTLSIYYLLANSGFFSTLSDMGIRPN